MQLVSGANTLNSIWGIEPFFFFFCLTADSSTQEQKNFDQLN